jgi:hypothetical protein
MEPIRASERETAPSPDRADLKYDSNTVTRQIRAKIPSTSTGRVLERRFSITNEMQLALSIRLFRRDPRPLNGQLCGQL